MPQARPGVDRVLKTLQKYGDMPLSATDVAEELGVHHQTAWEHLQVLLKEERITATPGGRGRTRYYRVAQP